MDDEAVQMSSGGRINAIRREFQRLYIDCSYSGQIHFEAEKSAEFFGKLLVFIPALVAAAASVLVALGYPKAFGAVGAVAAAVAATATLLGPERKAPAYRESANNYTRLRHDAKLELELLDTGSLDTAEKRLRGLREEYSKSLARDEPTSNRHYKKVEKRLQGGVLEYGTLQKSEAPSSANQ